MTESFKIKKVFHKKGVVKKTERGKGLPEALTPLFQMKEEKDF